MIRLFHAHQTRSMRVLWLLNELGVEFDLVVVPFDKSLREKDFLKMSPAGRVPALQIGDRTVWESGAMIELLCEAFPDPGLGRPQNSPERADFLVWLHFAETISQHVAALTQQHIMLYEDEMRSPIVMRLESARIGKCFDAIESRLNGSPSLLESGFSAADIAVGQAVYMARHFTHIGDRVHMKIWYRSITSRPAFKASLPPNGEGLYSRDFYEAWDA